MWLDEKGTVKIWQYADKKYVEGMNTFVFDGTEKTPTFFSLVADRDANGYVVSDGVHVNNGDGTFREDPTEAAKRPLDYKIVVDKKTNAGEYSWTIMPADGINNLSNSMKVRWKIDRRDISEATVKADDLTYTGEKQSIQLNGTYNKYTLQSSDYTLAGTIEGTDVNTYSATVKGAGNFMGDTTVTWKIVAADLTNAVVELGDALTFNGEEQEQLIKSITLGTGALLAAGYTIESNKGTNARTKYKLIIKGDGKNVTGTKEVEWEISPFDLSVPGNARVETKPTTYLVNERTVSFVAFAIFGLTEVQLTQNADIVILNNSNKGTNVGTYTLELEGTGNYTGKISAQWDITQFDLGTHIRGPAQVVFDATSFVYDGQKHNPTLKSLYVTGALLATLPTSDYTVKVSAETEAGDYTLTIESASNNVTGSYEVQWKITPRDLKDYTLTASNSMQYRNYTITPTLKFAAPSGVKVVPSKVGVEYNVLSGGEGIDAGNYTIKIEGLGNYTGTLEANWNIPARTLSNRWYMWLDETGSKKIYRVQDKVYVEGMNSFIYDGTEKTPTFFSLVADGNADGFIVSDGVHVNNGDGTFREDPTEAKKRPVDYKIVVDKKTDAGDFTWQVLPADGINNLSDSMTVVWRIQKRDIADASVELGDELTYNGSQQTKLVKNVTVNGGTLKVNYTISGNTGTDAGSYKLTLTGAGNFTGNKEITWEIKSLDLANAVINFGGNTLTYNGKEQTQTITQVAVGAIVLSEGKDFTVSGNKGTDAKTYTLTVTGDGKNVKGSKDAQWTIAQYDLSGATLTLKPSNFIYNGTAQKQEIDGVTAGALTLNAGTDYTISGDTQTNAGTHTLTITGTGNFKGTCSKAWQIAQFDLTNATFVGTTSFNYDRASHTPVVTEVTWNGVTLKAEFKVSATAKTDAGNYDFTLVPDGKNVTGSKTIAWEIKALNLKDAKIGGTLTFTYNGKAQIAKPTVTLGGLTLKEGTDYTLVATAQTDANSYKFSIQPKTQNFIESIDGTWEITAADISSAKVTLDKTELTYNFAEQQVKATSITLSGFTSFTYDISGDKATNAGNYEYTITGNGNFKGTVKVAWKILQITLSDANLASAFVPKEYNGKYVTHDDFPDVIVDGHTLVYGRDYTLTGLTAADNSDKKVSHVGHHEATLWGLNNFAGSFAVGFDIVARKIAVEWKVDGQPLKDVAEVAGGHEITALIQENDFLGDGPGMGTNDREGHMRYRIKILSGTASSVWADGNSSGQAATMQLTAKGKYSLSIEFFDGNGNGSGFNSPSKANDYTVTTQSFKIAEAAVEVKLNITTSVKGAVISHNRFYYDTDWRYVEQELSYSVTDANGNKLPYGVKYEMFCDNTSMRKGIINLDGKLNVDTNTKWDGFPGPGTYHVRFIGSSPDGLTSYTSPEEVITIEYYVNDQGYKSTDYFDGTTYWGKNSVTFTAERVGGKQFYVDDHLPINTMGPDEKERRKSFTFTTEGKKTLYYKNDNGLTGKIEVNIRFDDTAPTAHIGDGTTADKYLDSKAAGTQYWVYEGDLTAILAGEEGAYESGVKTLEYAFGEAGVEPSTFTAANKTTGYSLKLDHAHDVLYVRVTDYVGNSAVFTATFRHFEKPTASGWKYTKLSGGDFTLSLGNNAFDRAGGVSIGSVSLSGSQFDVNGNQITIRGSVLDELDMSADKENFEVKVSILPSDLGLNQIKNAKELDLACSLMAEVEKATLSESDLTFAPASHGGSFEYDGSAYTGSFTANVSYDTGAITVTFDGSSTVDAGTYKATANVAGSKYYKAASFKNDAWELVVQTRKLEIAIDPFTVEVGTAVQTEDVLYHFVTGSVVKGDEGTVFSFSVDGAELAQPGDKLDVKAECINSNYEIVFTDEQGACSIVAVKITDNTVDVIVEYDGTAHGLEFNFSMKGTPIDLNDGKTVTYKYSLTGNGSDWTETPITATNVKDSVRVYYFVEIENYGEVYGNKQIIINPAQITITITGAESTYGESQAAFSATVDSGTVYGSDVAYTLSCEVDEKSPVGQYEIKVENGENYEVSVTGGTAYYNVTAREITVTIDAAESIYGEQQAALTAQVTKGSLVNGDADPFELFCSVDAQTGAGSYDITGSQKDGNYKITFENGTGAYTVQKRVLTDKTMGSSVIYNGKEQSLNFVFEGFVNGDDIATASKVEYSALGDGSDWSETPITATNVKDSGKVVYYRVTFDNYEVVEGNAVLTIEAREIGDGTTLNVTSTHTYDGTAQEATFDVINTVVSLVRDVDYTVSYRDHTNAGKGVIVLTAKSENFKGTFEWEFEIAKASGLTTSASGYTGEYDGNAHDVGISVNGFIDGASIADGTIEYLVNGAWTSSYTVKDVADSGKIEYRIIFQNYEDAVGTFEVAISQRSLDGVTITIQGSYTYNGKEQLATFISSDPLLTAGDYEIAYLNNVNAGEATITLTGKNNFAGTISVKFAIAKAALHPNVSLDGWVVGSEAGVPVVSGNDGNGSVSYRYTGTKADGTAYDSAEAPTEAGDYTLTVTFAETANYLGASTSVDFSISAAAQGGVAAWAIVLLVIIILIDCALTGILIGLLLRRREREDEEGAAA